MCVCVCVCVCVLVSLLAARANSYYDNNVLTHIFHQSDLIHYRLRVVTNDGRQLTGQLLAFDKVSDNSFFLLSIQQLPEHLDASKQHNIVFAQTSCLYYCLFISYPGQEY